MWQPHDTYTIDYFIEKFSAMTTDYFSMSTAANPTDAWEWMESAEEAEALHGLIKPFGILLQVNDGEGEWAVYGDTIKLRIVNFLKYVKKSRTEWRDYFYG